LNATRDDKKLDETELAARFEESWPGLKSGVAAAARVCIASSNLQKVINALEQRGMTPPAIGRVACFKDGFESHDLYEIVLSEAEQRLYIFGRKNRKLFDKDHWQQLAGLPGRLKAGLDFRCLFLDPAAPATVLAHEHQDADFPAQLSTCIRQAIGTIRSFGLDPGTLCRCYSTRREREIVVVDGVVLFTPVTRSPDGTAVRLTRCGFELVDGGSLIGHELVREFEAVWSGAKPITAVA
jgi:hypothetical protein